MLGRQLLGSYRFGAQRRCCGVAVSSLVGRILLTHGGCAAANCRFKYEMGLRRFANGGGLSLNACGFSDRVRLLHGGNATPGGGFEELVCLRRFTD